MPYPIRVDISDIAPIAGNDITFEHLQSLPNIKRGWEDNLKIETSHYQVWLLNPIDDPHCRRIGIDINTGSCWIQLLEIIEYFNGTEWVNVIDPNYKEINT